MKRLLIFLMSALCIFVVSAYDNYKEDSSCVDGVVVYEGKDDVYVIETRRGYTIAERYNGAYLKVGDKVRGPLHKFSFKYLLKKKGEREIRVYIEDYMMSEDEVNEWLKEHDKFM